MKRKIFLDLDGVLADFDTAVKKVLGTDDNYKWEFMHGAEAFWSKLNAANKNLFAEFEPMLDAYELLNAVDLLKPTILTAVPKTDPKRVERQKRKWVRDNLGTYKVICCRTNDKPNYCEVDSILVDDRTIVREGWEANGGILIHHTSAANTITTLRALGVI